MKKMFRVWSFSLAAVLALPAWGATQQPAAASPASDIAWKHQLTDITETQTDAQGKQTHSLNLSVMDYFLTTISELTDGYPPKFASQADRDDVKDKLDQLIKILGVMDDGAGTSIDILRRQAFASGLAYRFDEPGSGQKTITLYQALLKRDPDEPAANFFYGAFLANTATLQDKSIPYLQKAVQGGAKQANYTLGLVYAMQSDKAKALACLEQYSRDYPDDPRAKQLIDAVQNDRVTIHHS
jgi:tetratricopeptide (TPR) repeat protein